MTERSYLHLPTKRSSWHVLGRVDDTGWFALCGLAMGTEYRAAMTLPWGEATCESCAAGVLRREDAELQVADDTVPG